MAKRVEDIKNNIADFAKSLSFRGVTYIMDMMPEEDYPDLLYSKEKEICKANGWVIIYPTYDGHLIMEGFATGGSIDEEGFQKFWLSVLHTTNVRRVELHGLMEDTPSGNLINISLHYNVFKEPYLRANVSYERFKFCYNQDDGAAPMMAQGIVIDINTLLP